MNRKHVGSWMTLIASLASLGAQAHEPFSCTAAKTIKRDGKVIVAEVNMAMGAVTGLDEAHPTRGLAPVTLTERQKSAAGKVLDEGVRKDQFLLKKYPFTDEGVQEALYSDRATVIEGLRAMGWSQDRVALIDHIILAEGQETFWGYIDYRSAEDTLLTRYVEMDAEDGSNPLVECK